MSNVVVDKQKIDLLANAIADKSGEPVTMTLDEMVEAVDGIQTGGGEPNLQAKTYTVSSAGTSTVTADSGYDGLSEVEVSVPSAVPWVGFANNGFVTESNVRKWHIRPLVEFSEGEQVGWMDTDMFGNYLTYNAVPSNTTVTPTESSQTIGGAYYMMEDAVTVNAISSTYVGSGITRRSSTDLTASGATVTVPSGYYSAQASKAVASGTAGAPTATKGAVSNHSVTVTPSVTNTTGYITGSTKTGTAVTVSASELVSGSETKTENGTYDVTNLAELVVNVQGTASSVQVGTITASALSLSALQFSGLNGAPTSFIVTSLDNISTSTYPIISTVCFDGTTFHGQAITSTSNANVEYLSYSVFNPMYNSGTLTINASGAEFSEDAEYKLVYTYGGSSSDIHTADVQVGSGATSITFPVVGRPIYWSCIFKSNFGTSSGYQRVITVENDGTSIYGLAMDSSAHPLTVWTATYSGGNLTITSQGTNNGGYFHQPGYYQLTYAVDDSAPVYQTKTVTPTTSQQVVTADTGYDALEQVTVNSIPSEYIVPTGNYAITSNGNNINIAQYATVSVNVPSGGSVRVATTTWTNNSTSTVSHQFTGLSGTPKAAFLRCTSQLTRSSNNTYYYIADIVWDGTSARGNYHLRSNGSYNNVSSTGTAVFTVTTGTNSITFSSSATSRSSAPGSFYNGTYELTYVY